MSADPGTGVTAADDETAERRRRSRKGRRGRKSRPADGDRRQVGRRTARRRARRRRTVRRGLLVFLLFAALGAGTVGLLSLRQPAQTPPDSDAGGAEPEGPPPAPTLVFATFDAQEPAAGASLVFVLGHDDESGAATILLLPAATVVDVPGFGLENLGRAFGYGGSPLLDATVDNLLGVDFDAVVEVSRQGWSSLFTRVGGLTVEVGETLAARGDDGAREVRFRPGEQHLDGPRLAELLTFSAADEGELASLARAADVLEALFAKLVEDPAVLDAIFEDGAPMLDAPLPAERVRALFDGIVEAGAAGGLDVLTLPVSALDGGTSESFRIDRERADALIARRFAASIPEGAAEGGRRLHILNGNGRPGIGEEVARRLVPAGFTVVKTGNADNFEHETTRIIIYNDDEEQHARARRIQELLGVGRIERSLTPQSVVDVTIVVGHDFLDEL
ncbi:MAG: LCP family protein [Nitriliruptorales bacterium]